MNLSSSVLVAVMLAVSVAAYGVSTRRRRPRAAAAGPAAPGRGRVRGRRRIGRRGQRGQPGTIRRRDDRGASALEWAVISAILVTAAVVIGGVIYNVVSDKSDQISSCGALGADAENCTDEP